MNTDSKDRRISVLITATNWVPISARVAVRFLEHGCAVSALCPRGHLLNHISGMGTIHSYDPFDPVASQASAILATQPDIIVPCDDAAVWQLHETYQERPEFRSLIEKSIGKASEYECIRSRVGFMALAHEMGLRAPDTFQIRSETDIGHWSFGDSGPAVMKLDGTSGGHGVKVVRSETEALAAFRTFTKPVLSVVRWKRHLVNCDPLAFWPRAPRDPVQVSLQRFIPGRPANAMFACWRGEVLGLVAVEVLASQGQTGAGTIIRFIQSSPITDMAQRLVARLGLSGFHGLDFILEETTDIPFLIELNPRCTQLGHLVLQDQGDLVGTLCRTLGSEGVDRSEPSIDGNIVAFFPQAVAWNPDSPYFDQSHQDIPWRQPSLVRELLRDTWSERRWPLRLYRRLMGRTPEPKPHLENLRSSDRLEIQKLLGQAPSRSRAQPANSFDNNAISHG
jgi:hypothetical protein